MSGRGRQIIAPLAFALGCCLGVSAFAPAHAQDARHGWLALFGDVYNAARKGVSEINAQATAAYLAAPRAGSCAERRAHLLTILPDALRNGRYSLDIYDEEAERRMAATAASRMEIAPGHVALRSADGKYYAEVWTDDARHRVSVVFRGTRLSERDVYTDLAHFAGFRTKYYAWAADLVTSVRKAHPASSVIVTGESLGGGLALYAVLKNPGPTGFVFNPTGIAPWVWALAAPADRVRMASSVIAISTRHGTHIDPVTALSLAGLSVLPGHVVIIPSDETNEQALHSAAAVLAALEALRANGAAGDACDDDLGVLTE